MPSKQAFRCTVLGQDEYLALSISARTLSYNKLKYRLPGSGRERKIAMRVCGQIEARTHWCFLQYHSCSIGDNNY